MRFTLEVELDNTVLVDLDTARPVLDVAYARVVQHVADLKHAAATDVPRFRQLFDWSVPVSDLDGCTVGRIRVVWADLPELLIRAFRDELKLGTFDHDA